MYNWRTLTEAQQKDLLERRKLHLCPWHSPPHIQGNKTRFHITGTCYEHRHIIGGREQRLDQFELSMIDVVVPTVQEFYAWAILPNHYHLLVKTDDLMVTLKEIFKLHQTTGYHWNKEDGEVGRKVWFNAAERGIKSDGHFYGTMNYIHNNPVKHGYVKKWTDWPYSTARAYIATVGRAEATRIWREYDISEMGGWDV